MPLLSAVVERRGEPLAPLDLELAIEGLGRPGGHELAQIVERAMAERANAVEKVREGNEKAIAATTTSTAATICSRAATATTRSTPATVTTASSAAGDATA